jgi:hypothetical protein
MDERDKMVEQTVARLQSIQTPDEFKAAKDEIIDLMEQIFKSGVDALKEFFENIFTMTPEEQEEKSSKFQDESYLLDPKIMEEMERLDQLPGTEEFGDEFEAEMEKRLGPYLEQYTEQMGKMMETFMGGMMEGVAEAMKPTEEEPAEEEFIFDYNNPDTPPMLYDLYAARSLEELEENKDSLIETLEEQMQNDIWDLEILTDRDFMEPQEEDIKKIETILHRMKRYPLEMEKEFTRISAIPGAAERAGEIKKEIMDRLNPKHREIKRHLAKPWRR